MWSFESGPAWTSTTFFAAAFPAGTMTGTPKVRAVEITEETEVSSRGLYAGSVGFLGFDGMVLTALCIRTASYPLEQLPPACLGRDCRGFAA
ncbi:anthranilate synthase component I [Bifidobacterium actinocoloniiforme DSM 22766]|uniref:Anthranilate synthase component I n=1 Tax=Bifidobacterium actinocoloniiforme DSM 22766 TaxID=1437605 RepID=A0A086Z2F3_9BIFI|nr:chorismate-binding protein [Bifidobacterium actinocoloniiforme]KFI40703.1 anthranilate synthase component I [Bifidobacterium actinocoloniiforme DSM 22766]